MGEATMEWPKEVGKEVVRALEFHWEFADGQIVAFFGDTDHFGPPHFHLDRRAQLESRKREAP